jgi:hypothetical protein
MMRMLLTAAALAAAVQAPAQTPSPSPTPAAERRQERAPREEVTALVNGKKVVVEYGRPALAGRKMGDLLTKLPADRIWRAGVDQATTLTTETDITLGGKPVPAGKYTVYVHAPANGQYSLILNRDPGVPLKQIFPGAPPEVADALWPRLDGYDEIKDKEVLRVPLRKGKAAEPMERFLIGLAPARGGASSITLTWGDESWTTEIRAAPPVAAAPQPEPEPETVSTVLDGRRVAVEYRRPVLRGRTMTDLLAQLPPDRMWRAGVHRPTTFTTDGDLVIGGRRVPAGRYTLFVHAPETGAYSLVLNSHPDTPERYALVAETEVLRVPMTRGAAGPSQERFVIGLAPPREGTSAMTLAWGEQRWAIDIRPAAPSASSR